MQKYLIKAIPTNDLIENETMVCLKNNLIIKF